MHLPHYSEQLLPRDAMLARHMPLLCVFLSVCLSQVGVPLEWLNMGSRKPRRTVAEGLYFSDAKYLGEVQTGSLLSIAPNVRLKSATFDKILGNPTNQTHNIY